MFQSFDASTSPDQGPSRLKRLREALQNKDISGYIVPRSDAHQGEYVAPCDDRLAWLTGFTGSAGFCIVLPQIAGVFIDGRYRVQVKEQVDTDHFTPVPWPETKAADWIRSHLDSGKVAYDPWLFTKSQIDEIKSGLKGSGVQLKARKANPVDDIWTDRPQRPSGEVERYPKERSGLSSIKKREMIAEVLRDADQQSAVLTLPDSICWLLNIRGSDIARIPIVQCFAIIHDDARVQLFIDEARVTHLGPDPMIDVVPPDEFVDKITKCGGRVRVDKSSAPQAVTNAIVKHGQAEIIYADDPCILPKACKNAVEIDGTKAAHLRDARAMVEFLAWLDTQTPGAFTEIDVVRALEGFRSKTNALRDISFDTISGAGANGAVVHYRVTTQTNRAVQAGELLLVDSGGQYVDGTTDITRTIAIGEPSQDHKECFTRVLQGMIAISRARFPTGLAGRDLDALARAPLWMAGLDYDHGTGHGVGTYLSVHEGPQRLSRVSEVKLQPGMILSNEPGYYREGEFGIRIENLIVVSQADDRGDGRDMLEFETITWVPIDRSLILREMLSPGERHWINSYHAKIAALVKVDGDAARWLEQATAPI